MREKSRTKSRQRMPERAPKGRKRGSKKLNKEKPKPKKRERGNSIEYFKQAPAERIALTVPVDVFDSEDDDDEFDCFGDEANALVGENQKKFNDLNELEDEVA